jgi:hypothetical protein
MMFIFMRNGKYQNESFLWNILRNIEYKIIQVQIFASRKQLSTRQIKGTNINSKSNLWHLISEYWHGINYVLMRIYLLRYSFLSFKFVNIHVVFYTTHEAWSINSETGSATPLWGGVGTRLFSEMCSWI